MKKAICTISSSSHLFKVKTLFESLRANTDADLHCLLTDGATEHLIEGVSIGLTDDLQTETATRIKGRYTGNELRWALKPVLMAHLLERGYDQVIYVDNDICFYSSPLPIFDALHGHSLLLTPHHYPSDPEKDQYWLEANFRVGLYNAGFVAASRSGVGALRWWAECCAYNVKKSAWRGLFDDQKYLDLMPVLFPDVGILHHKGCNVAGWNSLTIDRSMSPEGTMLLDGHWPLIFIHYNVHTMRCITKGEDPLLLPLMDEYEKALRVHGPTYSVAKEIRPRANDVFQYLRHLRWLAARAIER
jgi:hypothetical protein